MASRSKKAKVPTRRWFPFGELFSSIFVSFLSPSQLQTAELMHHYNNNHQRFQVTNQLIAESHLEVMVLHVDCRILKAFFIILRLPSSHTSSSSASKREYYQQFISLSWHDVWGATVMQWRNSRRPGGEIKRACRWVDVSLSQTNGMWRNLHKGKLHFWNALFPQYMMMVYMWKQETI